MAKRVEDIREFVPQMAAMSLNDGRTGSQWNVESASFVPGQVPVGAMGQRMMTPPLPGYGYVPPQGGYGGVPDQSGLNVDDFPPMQRGQQPQPQQQQQQGGGQGGQYGNMGRNYGGGNAKGQKYYKHQQQQQQQQAAPQQPISAVPPRMNPSAQYFPPSADASGAGDYYSNRAYSATQPVPAAPGGPSVGTPPPGRKLIQSFFMSDTLRSDLQKKTLLQLRGTNPDDPLVQNLPKTIHRYHSLYPLEDITKDKAISRVFGMPSFCYKAISMTDGKSYVLRKVDAPRSQQYDYGMQAVELWKSIQHPGVVGLKEVFVSPAFNNINSLFFVYEYFPGAETLELKFPIGDKSRPGAFISEESLWSFLIQLVAAIKAIHDAGLAARTVLASKVLLTGKNRIRLNCVGIDDFFNPDMRRNFIQAKQMEDIVSLGKLMVRLASPTVEITNPNQLPRALEAIAASYSPEFHQLLLRMLGLSGPASNQRRGGQAPPAAFPTLDEIQAHLSSRVFSHIDKLYSYNDSLESEMAKEIENGRLVRLLIKLGFVNERPEYDMSAGWSETGDRYLLKLFRDYVFHQVDEDGAPVLDFSHVIESLNKLDMGAEEKILLTSRDEKSMLVLSFKDLRRCLAEAFTELVQRQQQAQAQQQQQPTQQGQAAAPGQGSSSSAFPPGSGR
eukprot:TRINITY_DN6365_c0_g1_i1.p1 TRINITY_DN6365_c0_g1~~TRINITY_DN6365_c0_g1_i1.p1  ORF type:complete len:670 (+),score=153.29 TRINITY_DN6365_c0_g1_i1:180-2189(+)